MSDDDALDKPGPPPGTLRVKAALDAWVLPGSDTRARRRSVILLVTVVIMVLIGGAAGALLSTQAAPGGIALSTILPPAAVGLLVTGMLVFIATRSRGGSGRREIQLRAANLTVRRGSGEAEVVGWERIGPAEVTHHKEADGMGLEIDKGRTVRLRWAEDGRPFSATHARTDWEVLALGVGLDEEAAAWLETAVGWLRAQHRAHSVNAYLDDAIGGGHEARAREALEAMRDDRGVE